MRGAPTCQQVIRDVPSDAIETSSIGAFLTWVNAKFGYSFDGWDDLYAWSITDIEDFWESVWEYFDVKSHSPYTSVLEERVMPHARWFTGATLNYAEHSLGTPEQADDVAVTAVSQTREDFTLTLRRSSAARSPESAPVSSTLGVKKGDRVVGYLPNQPEALVAFLATASLGAIWASCAPEFGTQSVIDRFSQVEPTVLLAITGYMYGNKAVDRTGELTEVVAALPSLTHLVTLGYGDFTLDKNSREAVHDRCRDSSTRSTSLTMRDSGQPRRARMAEPPRRNWNSNLYRSTTRCSSSSPRARRASRRPSSTATAASCSRR